MSSRPLAPLVAAAAVVVALLAWSTLGRIGAPRVDPVGRRDAPVPSTVPAGPSDAGTVLEAPSVPHGTDGEVARVPVASSEPGDPPRDDRLTGEVLDALGRPLAGVRVAVQRWPLSEVSSLDLEAQRLVLPVGATDTDPAGRFTVDVPPHLPLEVVIEAPRLARVVRNPVFGGEHLRVALAVGAVLEGRVVAAGTGLGVADVALRGWNFRAGGDHDLLAGSTDATGGFRFEGLPEGALALEVRPRELASPGWREVVLEAGGRVWLDVELDPGVTVSGRISDAESGAPIAGAEVSADWTFERAVRTDADGRYVLRGFGGPGVDEVHARAPGHANAQHTFRGAPHTADVEVDFALDRGRVVTGRVVDVTGAALEGAYVAAAGAVLVGDRQRFDWNATRTGADGGFRLERLMPDLKHKLSAQHEGFGRQVYAFPLDEALHAELDLGTIMLGAPGRIVGTVVDEVGAPRPDLFVGLAVQTAEAGRWLPEGTAPARLRMTDQRTTVSDSRGRFHFADLAAGSYSVTVSQNGRVTGPAFEVPLATGEVRDDVVLEVPLGLDVSGVVVGPEGRPCERIVVRATPAEPGRPRSQDTTRADGTFRLSGLAAGRYRLEAKTAFFAGADGRELTDATVEAVEAGTDGVRIVLPAVAAVTGSVLEPDGAPAHDVAVRALTPDGKRLATARVDADGRFRLALPEGAVVDLEAVRIIPLSETDWILPEPPADAPPPPRSPGVAAGTDGVVLSFVE